MRIAFVSTEYITEPNFDGGLANYLGGLCPELASRGHEIVLFIPSIKDEFFEHNNCEIHRVCTSSKLIKWVNRLTLYRFARTIMWLYKSYRLNKHLRFIDKKDPFDVVQYTSYTATAIFQPQKLKSIVRISSQQALYDNAYGSSFSFDSYLSYWLESFSIKRANKVFSPSELFAKKVEEKTGVSVDVIESPFVNQINNVNNDVYRKSLEGKEYLLFFGSLGKLKGVSVIAEIVQRVLASNPDLLFVFIGKDIGYEGGSMVDHLYIKAGPFKNRIVWLGVQKKEFLYPVLRNAKAVVLPSIIDNLPNTCIEAMAMQRVVVGTKGASFDQLIEDGISGMLCEPKSPESLHFAIERTLRLPPSELDEIGYNALRRIEKLRPEIIVPKLIDYYSDVAKGL